MPRSSKESGRNAARSAGRRLAELWRLDHGEEFHALADECVASGRDGAFDEAMRLSCREGGEDDELGCALWTVAEMGYRRDEDGLASMDVFAVAVRTSPGAGALSPSLVLGLEGSGMFPDDAEILLADGWCFPADIARLTRCGARRVLEDIAAGRPPADLPMSRDGGAGVMRVAVGVAVRAWDECDDEEAEDERTVLHDDDEGTEAAVESWHEAMTGGRDPRALEAIRPCSISMLAFEIASCAEAPPHDGRVATLH